MFIFSSNAAKYSFEYKVSKLYRIDYGEKISISPVLLSLEHYRSVINNQSAFPAEQFSAGVSVTGIRMRDLLVEYKRFQENIATGVSIKGIRLKETLINLDIQNEGGGRYDEVQTGVKVTGIRLRTLLIENDTAEDRLLTTVSVKGIRRS